MADRSGTTVLPSAAGGSCETGAGDRTRTVAEALAATGIYLLLALLLCHRGLLSAHSLIGAGSDPYLFEWHLAWVAHALAHGTNPLLSRSVNVPGGENLMYAGAVPLAGMVLSPVTWLGGPVLSYNILAVACLVSSAAAAYAMCRRFVRWWPAAVAGGTLYGFSPYMAAQSRGHAHVTMAWFPPVVVIVADSLARGTRSPARLGILFGVAITTQLLLGTEILITSMLFAALGTVTWITVFRHDEGTARLRRRGPPAMAVAAVTVVVLGGFPLSMLLFGPQRSGLHSPLQPLDTYVNDLATFVVPGPAQLVATPATRSYAAHVTGNDVEASGYVGLPLLALLAFSLWKRWRDRAVRLPILAAAIGAVVSLGSHIHLHGVRYATGIPLPGAILAQVPVLWNVLPARLMLYSYLAIALALAVIIDRGRRERRRFRALAVGACGILLLPASVPARRETALPPAFRAVARDGGVALVTPTSEPTSYEELVWQADTGFSVRLVGGFTLTPRPDPILVALADAERSGRWPLPSPQEAAALRRSSLELGTTVVLDVPDRQAAPRRAFLASVFGPAQSLPDGFAVWHLRGG